MILSALVAAVGLYALAFWFGACGIHSPANFWQGAESLFGLLPAGGIGLEQVAAVAAKLCKLTSRLAFALLGGWLYYCAQPRRAEVGASSSWTSGFGAV